MNLMIIESAGKVHTLKKILGPDFQVLPTMGHMRKINDSGAYKTGIDCKNNFKVDYLYDPSKKQAINAIKEAAKTAEKIYVCSDADREGHGISEEIFDLLKSYKSKLIRTTFNEITSKAVMAAINNPTGFDANMAKASESRAILDRLIGYRTSNLVLSKIGAPSAGRVQSALLFLLSEREEEIQKFVAKKYYDVFLDFKKGTSNLTAKLFQIGNKKFEKIFEKDVADNAVKVCSEKIDDAVVYSVTSKDKLVEPKLPLTTSAMQQLASTQLGFAPNRTQKAAQSCYEKGLVTYIRTDSVRFSQDFLDSAKPFIEENYGAEYWRGLNIPAEKNKNAQDGHESIRPTDITKTPSKAASELEGDELKLYTMIYNYSLASMFVPAKVKVTDIVIKIDEYYFKVSGRQIVYESFLSFVNDLDSAKKLPEMKQGDSVNTKEVYAEEKETQPPQRYSEAVLVKLMEQSGIGRPSTFAPTIETLKKREYIKIEKKAVYVTELGMSLNKLLKANFNGFFEPSYTANMEDLLDKIANGELTELNFLTNFWKTFEPIILSATRNINKDKPKAEIVEGKVCPTCGKPLVSRTGKYGLFYACSGYPRCKYTEKPEGQKSAETNKTDIQCPICGDGVLVKRKNKKNQFFYGCSRWPKCNCTMSEDGLKEYLDKRNNIV